MHKKIILLSLAVLSVACSGPTEKEIPVTSVSISFPEIEMTEGDSFPLTATVLPDNATNKQVTWASTSPGIAFVSQDGVVTALSKGIAMITATAEQKSASCKVTVKEAFISVESVCLSTETLSLKVGETASLTATVMPENASDKAVQWTSSNPLIVSVDGGKVVAISVGSVTVTAKAGDKTATCSVSVTPISVSSVSLSRETLSMKIGDTEVLTATVLPENAADKTVTWSSSNTGVATVTDGAIKAVGIGSAMITASAGGKSATCNVTVTEIDVTSITLNKSSISLLIGSTETLTATVNPSNATDKTVTWSSSNSTVAIVSNGKVTAVSVGTATITASAGGKTATCSVTVNPIAVTSVTLNKTSLSLLIGSAETLTATVNPSNATDKTVTWSSSNAAVATVANGKVTAVSVGSATITATAGSKTATCQVTVKEKPLITSISISGQSVQDFVGGTYTITPVISPTDARYDLEWSVSETRVVNLQKGSGISMILRTKDYGMSEVIVRDKLSGLSDKITVRTLVSDFAWQEYTGQTYSGYPLITITEGDEYQLHYTCTPSNATHLFEDLSQFVFYEGGVVSNTTIISLDANGKVKGLKPGTVGIKPTGRIVCNTSAGQQRVYLTVKSKTIQVSGITLDNTSLSLKPGETGTLLATVSPSDASDKTVTWTSSNTSVATVLNGVVTAVNIGSAMITASAGGKTATCSVIVNPIEVTSVNLNKTALTLLLGSTETLIATVNPSNATYKTVTWTSSNANVATVLNGVVTTVGIGSTTITASAGGKTATCSVIVNPIEVTSVSLNMTALTLPLGSMETLIATVNPSNATYKTVTWTSSNPNVATVLNGVVTAVGIGSTTITASAGGKIATCSVTVNPIEVTSITFNKNSLTIHVGEQETLQATVLPSNATYPELTWGSSDNSVVTVEQGTIKAIKMGLATVTARASNGVSAQCLVTVERARPDDGGIEGTEDENWNL